MEGVQDFDISIAEAHQDQQPILRRLRDWAVSLRGEGLVKLQTYHTRADDRLSLLTRLPDENVGLVSVYNNGGVAALQIFCKVFERRAPESLIEVERIVNPDPIGQGTYVRLVTYELLDALTDAHREALRTKTDVPPVQG